MIDNNPMRAVCNYGSSAPYKDPPTEEQIRCGVIPLDSLPAAWWNWLWNETNGAVNEARTALTSVICEFNNVLCCAGITPQSACMDQLYNAIVCLRQAVATSSVAGSVKSSTTCGKVSVAADGTMTANGLGNVSNLTTTTKTNVVAAINELKATHDSELLTMSGDITALENGKLGCTACAADSAKLGGTEKGGLLTGVAFRCGCIDVTVGGTTCSVALGSAAACAVADFLAAGGCAADSALLGGTCKEELLTAFSCANNQLSITVGGTTCTAAITIPAACFGTAVNYTKFVCTTTSGTAAAADCAVTLGLARSYTLCNCPQNTGSYDRRTYSKIGTYQNQGACNGMTYLDTCVWQCCYSGSAGVTTCTNKRWCFCGDGSMYTPGKVEAKSDTFGCMLVANRTGSANSASVTFCNCNGLLGHLALSTKDKPFTRYNSDNCTGYTIYDTSMTGFTGCATCSGKVYIKNGEASGYTYFDATGCCCNPSWVWGWKDINTQCLYRTSDLCVKYACCATNASCASCNGSGTAFGSAAVCAATSTIGANCTSLITSGAVAAAGYVTGSRICQVADAQGYVGLRAANGCDCWIRTGTNGLLPVQSGNAGSGHSSLGTSTWYFACSFIDKMCGTAQYATCLKDNGGCATLFCWSGNNTMPTWVWGSSARGTTCVYNPATFCVKCATYAANVAVECGVLRFGGYDIYGCLTATTQLVANITTCCFPAFSYGTYDTACFSKLLAPLRVCTLRKCSSGCIDLCFTVSDATTARPIYYTAYLTCAAGSSCYYLCEGCFTSNGRKCVGRLFCHSSNMSFVAFSASPMSPGHVVNCMGNWTAVENFLEL